MARTPSSSNVASRQYRVALALSEAPQAVEAVHAAYIQSCANVITSNSYAVVPFHIGEARFAAEGQALAALKISV